jgi:two-component system, LytTR family, sensor kinase
MAKKKYTWIHVAAWTLYLGYCYIGIYYFPDSNNSRKYPFGTSALQTSYTAALASVFYYCYLLIYPNLVIRKRMPFAIIGLLLSPFVFIITRVLLEEVLYPATLGFHNYGLDTTVSWYIIDNFYRAFPTIAISAAIWAMGQAFAAEKENKSLREEKMRAELAFLKSQVNPHFLYNTLNYIYSLAYPVSEKLGDAVIRLSQLMRYMLTESPDGMTDLEKEIDYLQNYIEIYRLRFEDKFFVDFKIDGEPTGKRVPALVLVPFVENAFKHGVVEDADRPVKVHLKITGDKRLTFTVSNKINQDQKDHSSGIGLNNIRRRLELLCPGKHELLISENGQTYKTTLNLDL